MPKARVFILLDAELKVKLRIIASMARKPTRALRRSPRLREARKKRKSKPGEISSVRCLLETGLLEGAQITYISNENKLPGVIKGNGYLCGCSKCNYRGDVLSACKLEQHAHASTKNQTDHIFLSNGKSIYEIVQHLKELPDKIVFNEIDKLKDDLSFDTSKVITGNESEKPELDEAQVSEIYTVKCLLATGLLEGARVTFISNKDKVKLPGVIKGTGYLCGCSECSYRGKVFSALGFVKHGGASNINHNDHIFLSNGKSLFQVVRKLKKVPKKILCKKIVKVKDSLSFDNEKIVTVCEKPEAIEAPLRELNNCHTGKRSKRKRRETRFSNLEIGKDYMSAKELRRSPRLKNASTEIKAKETVKEEPANIMSYYKIFSVGGMLTTGLLEGAPISFVSKEHQVEIPGIIKGNGYLCGCSKCNYLGKVLSSVKFAEHACGTCMRYPNNHIFLSNGNSMYRFCNIIVETMKQGAFYETIGNFVQGLKFQGSWRGETVISEKDELSRSALSPVSTELERAELEDEYLSKLKKIHFYKRHTPKTHLRDVRGLLATRLLEGFRVTYMKDEANMDGLIRDFGYACGCSLCNYTEVLSANEFEKHAGGTSKNQNNNIYLDSGVSLYKLVKELENIPLYQLGDLIGEKIHCPPNLSCFEIWKGSFQVNYNTPNIVSNIENEQNLNESTTSDPAQGTSPENNNNNNIDNYSINTDSNIENEQNLNKSTTTDPAQGTSPVNIDNNNNNNIDNNIPKMPLYTSTECCTKPSPLVSDLETVITDSVSTLIPKTSFEYCADALCISDPTGQATVDNASERKPNLNQPISESSFDICATDCTGDPVDSKITSIASQVTVGNSPKGLVLGVVTNWGRKGVRKIRNKLCIPKWSHSSALSTSNRKNALTLKIRLPVSQDSASYISQKKSRFRDYSLHQCIFKEGGLLDGTVLTYCIKGEIFLTGYKHGNFIVCSCHNYEFKPSQFEAHAGHEKRRRPYQNIYTFDGKSLHELSLELINAQNSATYGLQSSAVTKTTNHRLTRVLQTQENETICCTICKDGSTNLGVIDSKLIVFCNQCDKAYHVGCLDNDESFNLEEVFSGNWFCCNDCHEIHSTLRILSIAGLNDVPAPLSNIIKRCETDEESSRDLYWRLLSGGNDEDRVLLYKVMALIRGVFKPIKRGNQDLIRSMVFAKEVDGFDFRRMFCAVIIENKQIVSVAILRVFGRSVAELPLVATHKYWRGKGYFQILLVLVEKLLGFLQVGLLLAPVDDVMQSIWINKFGFVKSTEQKVKMLEEHHPIMIFEKTTILEKVIPAISFNESSQHLHSNFSMYLAN